jgi:hypothetical protein
MADDYNKKSLEDIAKLLNDITSPLQSVATAISNMITEADSLNRIFLGGRVRIEEMDYAIKDSVSSINKLGGSISDVTETMSGIAEGARRNVIATEEQVSKLYASSKILETSASNLTESFGNAGYEVSQIGVNVEESIEYVQNLGLNAKTITQDVVRNLDSMNRFNFNDGVQGLTKMAAQASMLRFDMDATRVFAEKVISPEGAIQAAAGFQRLGLAVGSLGDPFKLMNDSINDPGALQDSIINATKQFTYFDEKTKSFRINPQGILTLKEMATEVGTTYEQLSKTALAAANLDDRLSAISPSIKFDSEEDKMFLANMAQMDKGEYTVKVKNARGEQETIKLGEITAEQITKLREQQANAPKTVEEIQRSQLDVLTVIGGNLESIINQMRYGVAGAKEVVSNAEGLRTIATVISSELAKASPETKTVSGFIDDSLRSIEGLIMGKQGGQLDQKSFESQIKLIEDKIIKSTDGFGEATSKVLDNIVKGIKGNSASEEGFKSIITEFKTAIDIGKSGPVKTKIKTIPEVGGASVFGSRGAATKQIAEISKMKESVQITSQKLDFGGLITIKVDAPPGVSAEYLNKFFTDFFNSESGRQQLSKISKQAVKTEMKATK